VTLEELVRRAGINVSVVKVSELESSLRVDSGYYSSKYLTQDEKLENFDPKPLSEVARVFDGNHMTIKDEFSDDGIRYLRGQDLGDFYIANANPVYISRELYDAMPRCHMKRGDVLVSVIGTVGSVSLVTEKYDLLTGSCKIAILRSRSVNPYFLAAYLLSDIGQGQIQRRVRGAIQQGLILPDLKLIPVPTVSNEEAGKIENLIKQSLQKKDDSVNLYAEAERLLAAELGLDRLDLSESLFNVRRVSDVLNAARIDAEFYQEKYYRLETAIHEHTYLHNPLSKFIAPIKNGFDFREFTEAGTPYLALVMSTMDALTLTMQQRLLSTAKKFRRMLG
jgi:type I restriction enzyme S subunit